MGSNALPRAIEVVAKLRPADGGDELGRYDRPECEDDYDPHYVVGQALNGQPPARPPQHPHAGVERQLLKSSADHPIHPRRLPVPNPRIWREGHQPVLAMAIS